jgi:hypothetical protein
MKIKLLALVVFLITCSALGYSQTIILNENFESSSLPFGWTTKVKNDTLPDINNNDSIFPAAKGWEFGNASQLSSFFWTIPAHTNFAAANDDKYDDNTMLLNKASEDFLITPSMNLTPYSRVLLKFKAFYDGKFGSDAFIKVSTDGGLNWYNVKKLDFNNQWRTELIDITPVLGNASNVKVAFHHDDKGGWDNNGVYIGKFADGFAIDDVEIYAPLNFDVAAVNSNMEAYGLNQATTIRGRFKNLGGETISSASINYRIGTGAVVTQNLTGLSHASVSEFNVSHPIAWNPPAVGSYTIRMWLSNINGNPDQNNPNDTIVHTYFAAGSLAERKVMFEQFTSNTCYPCASSEAQVKTFLTSNGANTESGKLAAVKYHLNQPGPGNDPSYTAEVESRKSFYGITDPNSVSLGGNAFNGHPINLTQDNPQILTAEKSRATIFEIDMKAYYRDDSVHITGKYISKIDISGNLKLHVAVVEKKVLKSEFGNGTTSQNEFEYVFRKMLPNASGTSLPAQTVNLETPFEFDYTFNVDVPIFSTMDSLMVIAFIQNNTTKEVYQSQVAPVGIDVGVNRIINEKLSLSLFPNPTKDFVNLVFHAPANERAVIEIRNMAGQSVHIEKPLIEENHTFTRINTQNLPAGLYFVTLTTSKGVITQKLSVLH